jgi:hypothetical protein
MMNSYRKTAITVGVLFIIATVIGVLGKVVFLDPVLDAPDYLIEIAANENRVILGALLMFFGAIACASIAIWLYPVLKKHHEALALGSVVFRVMESMLYILGVVGLLSLLALSQEYVKAGASSASVYQVSGTVLLAIKEWAGQLGVIAFTVGALMYYSVLYRSKLVPRLISGWDPSSHVAPSALLTISGLLVPFSTVFVLLQLPIGLQEMVLAVWLIVKGFNPSAVAALSAKMATTSFERHGMREAGGSRMLKGFDHFSIWSGISFLLAASILTSVVVFNADSRSCCWCSNGRNREPGCQG